MIGYAINVAKASGLFSKIIVSTDSEAIGEVAMNLGATVPFMRPAKLADDFTGTGSVINHAIKWLEDDGHDFEIVACIYPTVPLLTPNILQEASAKLALNPNKSYAFSVGAYRYPVYRALSLSDDGTVSMLFPQHAGSRSQDLPRVLHDAGQFYIGYKKAWLGGVSMFSEASIPIELPPYRVMDIDSPEDWTLAELYFDVVEKAGLR